MVVVIISHHKTSHMLLNEIISTKLDFLDTIT